LSKRENVMLIDSKTG